MKEPIYLLHGTLNIINWSNIGAEMYIVMMYDLVDIIRLGRTELNNSPVLYHKLLRDIAFENCVSKYKFKKENLYK